MKVERTPFTTFDFVGYFIPGFIFLYSLYLIFNIEFDSILTINKDVNNCKNDSTHEYILFTFFMILASWFVGHLLSWVSHVFQKKALKIFDTDENMCVSSLLDPFCQGKRMIFTKSKNQYDVMVDKLYEDLVKVKKIPDNLIENGDKKLFLKSISYYLDPEKYKTVYNYLVIQGTFRAFTLSFLTHAFLLFLGMMIELPLEPWMEGHFLYIFGLDLIIAFICWNIYLKYFRRQIEETAVLLIHELYSEKKEAK